MIKFNVMAMALALSLTTTANASVIVNHAGVNYEWLKVDTTIGLSRLQVENKINSAKPGDMLYGYDYASRARVESLLQHYIPWSGTDGYYTNTTMLAGLEKFYDDFGVTHSFTYKLPGAVFPVDSDPLSWNTTVSTFAIYGTKSECSDEFRSCYASVGGLYDLKGGLVAAGLISSYYGWDASDNSDFALILNAKSNSWYGSFLVRAAPVPIPAAFSLFPIGLLGLIAFIKRK